MFIGPLSTAFVFILCRFLNLTSINIQELCFLIKINYSLLSNSLTLQLSTLLTLQLTCSPTLLTIARSTSSSLVLSPALQKLTNPSVGSQYFSIIPSPWLHNLPGHKVIILMWGQKNMEIMLRGQKKMCEVRGHHTPLPGPPYCSKPWGWYCTILLHFRNEVKRMGSIQCA